MAEAAEEEEAPKPKPKNPLDLLPPSKMVLDDWKRLFIVFEKSRVRERERERERSIRV